jgi:diguanylate cyclase (GGDEF)-like protein/PAS domain S-box-containing protein
MCTEDGGVLVGELNLSELQETVLVGQNNFSRAQVFLVDQNGSLLAHPEQELVEQQFHVNDWDVVQNGLKGNPTVHYLRDRQWWVGNTSQIEPTGWLVITETPLWTIYAPYLTSMLILIFVFAILFSLVLRSFLNQAQIRLVQPLTRLSAGTDALATGDYAKNNDSLQIPDSFAEMDHLRENFQQMRAAIISRETLLKESEEQYRRLIEFLPEAITLHRNGFITYVNAAGLELYRAETSDDMVGKSILEFAHPDMHEHIQSRLEILQSEGDYSNMPVSEQKHLRIDQSVFNAEVTTSSIFFDGELAAQSIIRDITERKDEEQRLQYLASHDYLTDLPNRFYFQNQLNHCISRSFQGETIIAVLYLDIDNFKEINDAFGHGDGDLVMQQVADILRQNLHDLDMVARIGGDEFVILMDDLDDPRNAALVANKILQLFSHPLTVQDRQVFLTLSIGISIFPNDGHDAHVLLQSADAAMYHAKGEGKNRFSFYSADMRSQSLERIALASEFRNALDHEEFFLLYQPQVNSFSGELIGVEALVRWQHPALGIVPPSQFIPLAEETGLIIPLGEWILQNACQQGKRWQEISPLRVAVNISDRQLKHANLRHAIRGTLDDTGFPPHLLEVELTENIIFRNARDSFRRLYGLMELGVQMSVDDFGTGYSTLGYLAHFPFNRLKIDQRLAPNITSDPRDAAIIAGIITIGDNLGMQVIAEGVETSEQLSFYESQGCFDIQGWYYSKPVSSDKITEYLEQGNTWKKDDPH